MFEKNNVGDYEKTPFTLYGYRRIPYECYNCKMKFHKQYEYENHKNKFCSKSIYGNKDYQDYISLREKIKNEQKVS